VTQRSLDVEGETVSRFQKIFLATTLVVVGFFVAKFLGQPVKLPDSLQAYRAQAQTIVAAKPVAEPKIQAPSNTTGGVRLLPDAQVTRANPTDSPTTIGAAIPVLAAANASNTPPPRTFDFPPLDTSPNRDVAAPRAMLRNEAPRPVGVDPQSPASIRRTATVSEVSGQAVDPYKVSQPPINLADAPSAPMNWPAPQLITAEYSAPAKFANSSPAAIAASFSQSTSLPSEGQLSPPPWPATEENAEPRTHIVVDGDTLEKLAGRYLSDPHRSREIFELNHEMLSSPDLLPIGAELKIPERLASIPRDRQVWQPNSSVPRGGDDGGRTNNSNVMPVQPASMPTGIIPRAQLARPVMVE
jgi:nucleoid-associated protein YgaU